MGQKRTVLDYDKVYTTKRGEQYKIIEDLGLFMQDNGKRVSKCRIKFLQSGFEKVLNTTFATRGITSDPYFVDVYGVGYMGEIPNGSFDNRIRNVWLGMLGRCYNRKDNRYFEYGEAGVTVCDRWKCFANFYEDYRHLPGYQNYIGDVLGATYHLDKDLLQYNLSKDQRVYSPETCVIIKGSTNSALVNGYVDNKETRAVLEVKQKNLVGVIRKPQGYYESAIISNKVTGMDTLFRLGTFQDLNAAMDMHDYFASRLGMPVNKPFQYYTVKEMLNLLLLKDEPVFVPEPVIYHKDTFIENNVQVIFGRNSKYFGVMVHRPGYVEATYTDPEKNTISLGFFDTEIKAAYVHDQKCRLENKMLHTVNSVPKLPNFSDIIIPTGLSTLYTAEERVKGKVLKTAELPAFRYHIGQQIKQSNGDVFEIIDIADEAIRTSYTKVLIKIRFLATGYETIIVSRILDIGENVSDMLKPTVFGIGCYGGEYENNEVNVRINRVWYYVLQEIVKLYPDNPTAHIDPRWLNFLNFLEDAKTLPGFHNFMNSIRGYVFTNLRNQYMLPKEQRLINKQTCEFMEQHIEEKYKCAASMGKSTYGVFDFGNGSYKVTIRQLPEFLRLPNNVYTSTYTNLTAALNIVNIYCLTYFGIAPNQNIPYMSYQECQKYRVLKQPLQLMYTLVKNPNAVQNPVQKQTQTEKPKQLMYHLYNTSKEDIARRTKAIYGIDLSD